MSTLATPVLSLAVQVIGNAEPIASVSPPFGLVTVTVGAWLSYGTLAGAPPPAGSGWLLQSRSDAAVTVSVPVPPAPALVTPTLNRSPLVAVAPQFAVSAPSTR